MCFFLRGGEGGSDCFGTPPTPFPQVAPSRSAAPRDRAAIDPAATGKPRARVCDLCQRTAAETSRNKDSVCVFLFFLCFFFGGGCKLMTGFALLLFEGGCRLQINDRSICRHKAPQRNMPSCRTKCEARPFCSNLSFLLKNKWHAQA